MDKRNLRRLNCLITVQTNRNIITLAKICGYKDIGRVIDKLVREKMLSLRVEDRPRGGR